MKKFAALLALLCAGQVLAQQTSLRCVLTDEKDGKQSESWIVIDPAANYMRVDGVVRPLIMSNDRYMGTEKPSGPFQATASIDRNTGEIKTWSHFQNQYVLPKRGTCEKAALPATKF